MQSLRVGVTAGRFSPKIRPNRFLGFSRGFHFLVRFTMQEIGLCAQIIGHKDAVRLEEKSEEQVRCGVFLDPTESLYLMATGGQVPLCVAYELG